MFWTEWAQKKIMSSRAPLDGSEPTVLIESALVTIYWSLHLGNFLFPDAVIFPTAQVSSEGLLALASGQCAKVLKVKLLLLIYVYSEPRPTQ